MIANTLLDVPKGAEWMIGGAHIPFLRFKQHPLEDAGWKHDLFKLLRPGGPFRKTLKLSQFDPWDFESKLSTKIFDAEGISICQR